MTIQEIKDIFNIDITERNRTDLYVYLRALYVSDNLKEKSYSQIGRELSYGHDVIIHYSKRIKDFETDPLFMYIKKAFKNKDVVLFNEYNRLFNERRLNRSLSAKTRSESPTSFLEKKRNTNVKKVYKKEHDYISKDFSLLPKEHIFVVAEKLRFKKTYLNEKPYNEWTGRDRKLYQQLTS